LTDEQKNLFAPAPREGYCETCKYRRRVGSAGGEYCDKAIEVWASRESLAEPGVDYPCPIWEVKANG
jgi:hypothetical protein